MAKTPTGKRIATALKRSAEKYRLGTHLGSLSLPVQELESIQHRLEWNVQQGKLDDTVIEFACDALVKDVVSQIDAEPTAPPDPLEDVPEGPIEGMPGEYLKAGEDGLFLAAVVAIDYASQQFCDGAEAILTRPIDKAAKAGALRMLAGSVARGLHHDYPEEIRKLYRSSAQEEVREAVEKNVAPVLTRLVSKYEALLEPQAVKTPTTDAADTGSTDATSAAPESQRATIVENPVPSMATEPPGTLTHLPPGPAALAFAAELAVPAASAESIVLVDARETLTSLATHETVNTSTPALTVSIATSLQSALADRALGEATATAAATKDDTIAIMENQSESKPVLRPLLDLDPDPSEIPDPKEAVVVEVKANRRPRVVSTPEEHIHRKETPREDAARAQRRSEWLDARLIEKEWVSDLDIQKNGGPAYNTIHYRYRSGILSNQDRSVRLGLSKLFKCALTDVPE